MNSWYVITGGPSTGKTTLLEILERRGYKTIPEAARRVIDDGLAKGLTVEQIRLDEKKFQDDVMRRKIEVEAALDPDTIIFFDRGHHDTTAYLSFYNYKIDEWIRRAVDAARYAKVFLLDPLETFTGDYARTETVEFAARIQQLLFDAYDKAGMTPVRVPANGVDQRLQFILKTIK